MNGIRIIQNYQRSRFHYLLPFIYKLDFISVHQSFRTRDHYDLVIISYVRRTAEARMRDKVRVHLFKDKSAMPSYVVWVYHHESMQTLDYQCTLDSQ